MNVASVITPKIDAAMATFKQRALVSSASTTPNVSVCDGGATGRDDSAGTQQGAAPQAVGSFIMCLVIKYRQTVIC